MWTLIEKGFVMMIGVLEEEIEVKDDGKDLGTEMYDVIGKIKTENEVEIEVTEKISVKRIGNEEGTCL